MADTRCIVHELVSCRGPGDGERAALLPCEEATGDLGANPVLWALYQAYMDSFFLGPMQGLTCIAGLPGFLYRLYAMIVSGACSPPKFGAAPAARQQRP